MERDGDYLTKYMESLIRTVKSVDLLIQTICNTIEQIKQKCTILYNCYLFNMNRLKQCPSRDRAIKTTAICTMYNLIILYLDNHKQPYW